MDLHWTDKGGTPFISWSIDATGPFPWDKDWSCYPFVTVEPFSRWVETHAMPLLHSYRTAKFLYNDVVTCWGKPCYVQIDNSTKFLGNFTQLCKGLSIIHHHITVGIKKANGQVKRMIQMPNDCIWNSLMKEPTSFWMNHLALALLLICLTVSQVRGIVLYLLATVHQPLLPSMTVPGLPLLPAHSG